MTPTTGKKFLFIINPKAGNGKPTLIQDTIRANLPANINYEIRLWDHIEEFSHIRDQLKQGAYTHAIAVGGDGTVNQVATSVTGSTTLLGIIPAGSGNGLARTLGMSLVPELALKQIMEGRSTTMDYGQVNDLPFFCTSGVGFDAHIGQLFSQAPKRGLRSYVRLAMREMWKYKAHKYQLRIGEQILEREAFLITIANAPQFGNDFYIAPSASLHDGLFHIAVLRRFPLFSAPFIALKLFLKTAERSAFIEMLTANELEIIREKDGPIHYDGEPAHAGMKLHYKLISRGLKVIVGPAYPHAD